MTLQDYFNSVTDSLGNYFTNQNSVVVPVLVALVILIVGLVVASVLRRVWVEIAKFINLEKALSGLNEYSALAKANKGLSLTELLGSLIWWAAVLVFVLPALKALGITQLETALGQLFGYVPSLVLAAFYLGLGAVIAWFAYLLVLGVGSLVRVPASSSIGKTVSFAVIVVSLFFTLKTLGVSDELIRFGVLGLLAASALALGLAGKDLASDLLKKVRDMVK